MVERDRLGVLGRGPQAASVVAEDAPGGTSWAGLGAPSCDSLKRKQPFEASSSKAVSTSLLFSFPPNPSLGGES